MRLVVHIEDGSPGGRSDFLSDPLLLSKASVFEDGFLQELEELEARCRRCRTSLQRLRGITAQ